MEGHGVSLDWWQFVVAIVALIVAASVPGVAAMRWIFRLESRQESHEKVCTERYRNLEDKHSEALRQVQEVKSDVQEVKSGVKEAKEEIKEDLRGVTDRLDRIFGVPLRRTDKLIP